jgi:TonB-linked SusC/RagA family outer membrane protein
MKRQRLLNATWCSVFALLLLVSTVPAFAQTTTVRGKVTDNTGEALPGVSILIKGTSSGAITDASGDYTVDAPAPSSVLVFSFIGYTTVELEVNSQTTINVSLEPSTSTLGEVIVVGYGTQLKRDVTGSIVTVNSKAIKEVPVSNLQMALQGRAAGVEVQRVGTAPGGDARIRIRGERSVFGSNAPLIVLDGIPYEGGLSDINQDEIATFNILKDASATAIYGSRGANGVILITTKRGVSGKTRLSFDSYYGVTKVARKYDMFNAEEYAAMRDYTSVWPYLPEEVEGQALGRNTDWQDLMYQDGYITNHNLGVTGGGEATQFALGAGYYKETTILPGQDFQRFSVKATVDTQIGKRLKLGVNSLNSVSISNGTQFVNQQPNTLGAFGGSMMYNMLSLSPLMPAYTEDGEIIQRPAGNGDDVAQNYSPLYLKENDDEWIDRIRRLRTFNSLFAEVTILDELKYRFNLGLDYGQQNSGQFQGQDTYFRTNNLFNRGQIRNSEQYTWVAENILTYEKVFAEKHKVSFTGLFSAQQTKSFSTQTFQDHITANFIGYYNLGLSDPEGQTILSGDESTRGLLSYMGRVNYSFDDRYMLTFTYRRDGSSVLANKWHNYPAIALGWNVLNEDFIPDLPVLTSLKLRVGYGQTSNQSVNPYSTLGGVNNNYQNIPIKYNYGTGTEVSGYLPTKIPDKTLDWEYTKTTNIGLDFGLLEDRVTASLDWYYAKTHNLLFPQGLPITSGYPDSYDTNVGEIENKGLEIAISGTAIAASNGFRWEIDLNWFYNRNELTKISAGVDEMITSGLFVGHPITAIYDYEKLGVWQLDEADEAATFGAVPGQLKLADLNNDGLITREDDRKVIGNQQAKWQGGITNRFSFKGFDLSFVVYMRYGGLLNSYLHAPNGAYLTNLNGQRNQLDVDYWTPTNPTNAFPAPGAALPGGAESAWTTLAYYDASFVRMRSINVGYTLPKTLIEKVGLQSARVYVTAQNPFLIYAPYVRKHNGVDPEPTGQGNTGAVATAESFRFNGPNPALIISASTPPTRSFIVGLNLSF